MQKLYAKFSLNCNDIVKNYCLKYLEENWNFTDTKIFRMNKFVPELQCLHKELIERQLPPVKSMSIFCRGPNMIQKIHIDTTYENEKIIKAKTNLYIPLFNENGGKLVWFSKDNGIEINSVINGEINSNKAVTPALYVVYPYGKLPQVIGEYTGSDPVIINSSIPHRAESGNAPRAALSFRLEENVDLFEIFNLN